MKINDMPETEKPREKALLHGIRSLSSRELIALILRSGAKGQSVLETADRLLEKAGGVSGIGGLDFAQLKEIRGISDAKALGMLAGIELSRRMTLERAADEVMLDSPEKVKDWLREEIGFSSREHFIVLYLDVRGRLIRWKNLFSGTVSESRVFPRDVIREGLLCSCSFMILVHNHPSGVTEPSSEDIALTGELIRLGSGLGMQVSDHLIVSRNGCFSFAAEGLLEECMEESIKEW